MERGNDRRQQFVAARVSPRLGCILLAILLGGAGCAPWARPRGPPSAQAPSPPPQPTSLDEPDPVSVSEGPQATQPGIGAPNQKPEHSDRADAAATSALRQKKPPPPPPEPKDVAKATRLVARGLIAYRKGNYDRAEGLLKEAISIYPFLPRANLALGKIFLIRGSADRDPTLISRARLMFEMAHALDPAQREPDALLELFRPPADREPE